MGAVAKTLGCALWGLETALTTVEVDVANGLPHLDELRCRTRLDHGALRARLVALVLSGAVADQGDGRYGRSR